MVLRRALPVATALAAVLCIAVSLAAGPTAADGGQCVRLVAGAGSGTLVNTCDTCRNVRVKRTRGGAAKATSRSYTLHPGLSFPLPFKGPGRTMILRDSPCEGPEPEAEVAQEKAEAAMRQCIRAAKTERGLVLVNTCTKCREAVVERGFADGRRTFMPYEMPGRTVLPVATEGVLSLRLANDAACD